LTDFPVSARIPAVYAAHKDGGFRQGWNNMTLREAFKRVLLGPDEDTTPELGRNDRCWCGSGRKYKACHLAADERKRASQRSSGPNPAKGGMF
jgi:hypothetical protein